MGWTDDLRARVATHNRGKVKSTKNRLPFELVYYEAGTDKKKAIAREKYFKTGFGRMFLKNRI
jgi:putative endonuclease